MDEIKAKNVRILIDELEKAKGEPLPDIKSRKFEVSSATSLVSTIYERVRNTIDFKDEHFIRRFAIQRFLRIYLNSRSNPDETSELLLKDLLRGKYIQDIHIADWKVEAINRILKRYIFSKSVLNEMRIPHDENDLWDFLLGIASSEIEKVIDPSYKPEVFIKLMAQYVLKSLRGSNLDFSPEQESLHVFIACHKCLVRSDHPVLRYHAFSILYPHFFSTSSEEELKNIVLNLIPTKRYIDGIIKSRMQELLYIQIRKMSVPFKVLQGALEQNPSAIADILSNEDLLKEKSADYVRSYYLDLKKKLNLRITRTLVYLFITKMLLAILIEAPVDLFIIHHVNYLALSINTFFPIILFYLIAKRINIPDNANNERIYEIVKEIVYSDKLFSTDREEELFKKRVQNSFHGNKVWLNYLYGVLYLVVYGVIGFLLSKIGFNITSIILFFFFVSVLSFFAWNIRARSRDLQIIPKKDNVIEALLNMIALPILKVGQTLSVQVSRFNLFTMTFDFILEAPFKIIIQSFEDLIDFLKSKHEEVVDN